MPKTEVIYVVPCNILLARDGTKDKLRALAYLRGDKQGRYAGPARQALMAGLDRIISGLSKAERAQYDQILANLKLQDQIRRDLDSSGVESPSPHDGEEDLPTE